MKCFYLTLTILLLLANTKNPNRILIEEDETLNSLLSMYSSERKYTILMDLWHEYIKVMKYDKSNCLLPTFSANINIIITKNAYVAQKIKEKPNYTYTGYGFTGFLCMTNEEFAYTIFNKRRSEAKVKSNNANMNAKLFEESTADSLSLNNHKIKKKKKSCYQK